MYIDAEHGWNTMDRFFSIRVVCSVLVFLLLLLLHSAGCFREKKENLPKLIKMNHGGDFFSFPSLFLSFFFFFFVFLFIVVFSFFVVLLNFLLSFFFICE